MARSHRTSDTTAPSIVPSISPSIFQTLEPRRLLSGSQITYANFASTSGLVLNGYGKSATTNKNHALILTDALPAEARTAYFNTAVGTQTFSTTFAFGISPGDQTADGFTFVLQN